jgi:hypothetical protein
MAYGLFAASVAGTIYSAIKGVLPVWAITIYVSFAVQLTFMTFMYAIRHSGAEEIRRSIYDLRRQRVDQWQFEREMLAEFSRYAFCTAHNVDPKPISQSGARRSRLRPNKAPWPTENPTAEICKYVRDALKSKIEHVQAAKQRRESPDDQDLILGIDFIAYSSETLINLSRDISAEIDEVVQDSLHQFHSRFEGIIKVRILIRDTTQGYEWLVPLATEEQKDKEYAADLRTRFKNVQRSALKEFQESLKDVVSPKQVDFHVRGYRLEPLIKGVLVDGSKGIFGLYTVDDLKDPQGWDYSGHAVTMCPCDRDGEFVSATAAHFLKRWFDLLWENNQFTKSLDT